MIDLTKEQEGFLKHKIYIEFRGSQYYQSETRLSLIDLAEKLGFADLAIELKKDL